MNIGTIHAGLRSLLNDLSGVATTAQGEEQFQFFVDSASGLKITFNLISCVEFGIDEVRGGYDEDVKIPGDTYAPEGGSVGDLGAIVTTVCGPRQLTYSIKVECHNQADNAGAFTTTERIRSRLRFPTSRARLNELGVGIARMTGTRVMSLTQDSAIITIGQFDLILNAASVETDEPVTTIETVEGIN